LPTDEQEMRMFPPVRPGGTATNTVTKSRNYTTLSNRDAVDQREP